MDMYGKEPWKLDSWKDKDKENGDKENHDLDNNNSTDKNKVHLTLLVICTFNFDCTNHLCLNCLINCKLQNDLLFLFNTNSIN